MQTGIARSNLLLVPAHCDRISTISTIIFCRAVINLKRIIIIVIILSSFVRDAHSNSKEVLRSMEGGTSNKSGEHVSSEGKCSTSATATSATTSADRPFSNPMPHVIPTGENAAPLSVTGCTATEKVIIIMVGVSSTRADLAGCVYEYEADYNIEQLTIVP